MSRSDPAGHRAQSPFRVEHYDAYCRWRDQKMATHPKTLGDLVVEVDDPRALKASELEALRNRCQRANMAIYSGKTGNDPDPEIPLSVGRAFELEELTPNWLADDTGITSLKVVKEGVRQQYIPYTDKAIQWHTDGYYNTHEKQIHSLIMHAVQSASKGGENGLMDHEMAYLLLRERNPDYVAALMEPRAMTIPERRDEQGEVARKEEVGPVFHIRPDGNLHMRYTRRAKNVVWAKDPLTTEALACLSEILAAEGQYIFRTLLEPGMGLVSHNVLHDRLAFADDDASPRHYYRARYASRLAGVSVALDG